MEAMEASHWSKCTLTCNLAVVFRLTEASVYYPIHYTSRPNRISRAAVIYLPRGPLLNNSKHDDLNLATLRNSLYCPVVRINYRCDNEHKQPTAIHDVIAGYDWVVQNLCDTSTGTSRCSHGRIDHKIAVCGELLGGSLATTLALTECRAHDSTTVVAAAVNTPITNWVDIGTDDSTKSCPDQLTYWELHRQRNYLFRSPAAYFDPFASPALFFRAAGSKVPISKPPLSDMEELAELEKQDFFRSQLALSAVPNSYALGKSKEDSGLEVSRKSSRRFPPKNLSLRLPRFRITAGSGSILAEQSNELADLLVKAVERQNKAKFSSYRDRAGVGTSQLLAASDMIVHHEVNGSGLWDDTEDGRSRMRDTALWLEEALQ